MFTGLVQAVGTLARTEPTDAGRRLAVDFGAWSHRPHPGDSIAISGCCLTVVEVAGGDGSPLLVSFDAVPETLARTILGALEPGSRVNLEHAVTASTLMGGHMVQGHVDALGRVEMVTTEPGWRVRIAADADAMPCIVPKGSITVDGVSLTVAATRVHADGSGWFEVALIPETLERTTLDACRPGNPVNLETDMIARTVVHYLQHFAAVRP